MKFTLANSLLLILRCFDWGVNLCIGESPTSLWLEGFLRYRYANRCLRADDPLAVGCRFPFFDLTGDTSRTAAP